MEQRDRAAEIRYVADLVGVNLLRGTARGTSLDLDGGGRLVTAGDMSGQVLAVIAPHGVSVSRDRPASDTPSANVWPGQVSAIDLMGDRVRVRIDGTPTITAEVHPAAVDDLKLDDGGQLWASIPPPPSRCTPRDPPPSPAAPAAPQRASSHERRNSSRFRYP